MLGFTGNLIVYPNGKKLNKEHNLAYDLQHSNSPTAKSKENTFRSTFHNTINGKFNLDLPLLNEKHEYSNEYSSDKKQSANEFSNFLHNTKKKQNP